MYNSHSICYNSRVSIQEFLYADPEFTDTKGWISMANKQDIQADTEEKTSVGKELFQWVLVIIGAVILAFLIDTFVIVNAQIPSGSMENTIMTGDRVFGNRLAYKFSDPKRFDIIIFKYPDDESQLFIKRIIGLPGETVEIHDGNIYINGSDTPLEDVDIKEPMEGSFGPYTVPEGCYFVMGDNRNNSRDSRYWENTFVSEDEILGKAVFRYWPLNKMKFL